MNRHQGIQRLQPLEDVNTITYDRERLREYLRELPPAAREAAAAAFRGYPKLDNAPAWPPVALAALVGGLGEAVKATGFALWAPPIDTIPLRERIAALPDDLADFAADEAREFQCPHVNRPDEWTEALYERASLVIGHCEAHATGRLRSVMAAFAGAGIKDADERHAIIRLATRGRIERSKRLTGPEARHIAAWCDRKSLRPETTGDIEPYVPDWKAEAKALSVTQAELLKQAKEWAKGRRLEVPKKLADITDHRILGTLLWRAGDGRSTVGEVAQAAAPVIEEARDLVEELTPEPCVPEEPAAVDLPSVQEAVGRPEGEPMTILEQAQTRMADDVEREAGRRDRAVRDVIAAHATFVAAGRDYEVAMGDLAKLYTPASAATSS